MNELIKEYFKKRHSYKELGHNLKQAIETFLTQENIAVHSIEYRIKELHKYLEKVERKNYTDPFSEMDDLCGLRIICYFQSDIEKVCRIIEREFFIHEKENITPDNIEDSFGYRARHYTVSIKPEWENAPNYRGLGEYRCEIQLKTILMHAWAEIEHKLSYKKREHIPAKFQEKFFALSKTLQRVDEDFESLMNEIESNHDVMLADAKLKNRFNQQLGLNLDNLQAFLDYYSPDKSRSMTLTRDLLDEFIIQKVSIRDLIKMYENNEIILSNSENNSQTELARKIFQKESSERTT